MDNDFRILAVVSCDACHTTSDIVWSNNNEMIIETIFGIFLTVAGGGDQTSPDPAGMIYKGIITAGKIERKEKNKEMDDSIHEELHLMTKDFIYKLGGIK